MNEKLFLMTEASARSGVPKTTIRRWAKTGQLPVKRAGRVRLFSEADIEVLLRLRAVRDARHPASEGVKL